MADAPNSQATSPNGQAPDTTNGQAPTAQPDPNSGKQGGDGSKVEIDAEEYQRLKRDAGRHQARVKAEKDSRRSSRQDPNRSRQDDNIDDPDTLEQIRIRDSEIDAKNRQLTEFKVKDKVRDLLDSDEYKDLPRAIKRAVTRNPMGFTNNDSRDIEEYLEDIQGYLDDELDNADGGISQQPQAGTPPKKEEQGNHQIPPASGSGPGSPSDKGEESIEGKRGSARSTAVLKNLMRRKASGQ